MYKTVAIAGALVMSFQSVAQDANPTSNYSSNFKNSTEAGVILKAGNSSTRNYNVKQNNSVDYGDNRYKLFGQFLRTESFGAETAKWWNAGLRYERHFSPSSLGLYGGASVESSKFAGYDYRYNADVGLAFTVLKNDDFWWVAEIGYRYTIEDFIAGGPNLKSHYGRAFMEIFKDWTPTLSAGLSAEYLPNFSHKDYWQFNTEASINMFLNEVFSVKLGYLAKYSHTPVVPATNKWDTFFTTALVAKF